MWIKSSDTDLTDRRLLEAGPLGHHLYHRAQLWMANQDGRTGGDGGHISRRALRSLDDFAGITEDGAAVTLDGLAARLVKLELWRDDGDSYYDLRYDGLNPADLIEKRREAGKASAAARAAKFGTPNPRANREHREHIAEHIVEQSQGEQREHREQNVNRTRTRTRSSKRDTSKERPSISAKAVEAEVSISANVLDDEQDGRQPVEPPVPVFAVVKPLPTERPLARDFPGASASQSPIPPPPGSQNGRPTRCRACHSSDITGFMSDSIRCLSCGEVSAVAS